MFIPFIGADGKVIVKGDGLIAVAVVVHLCFGESKQYSQFRQI